MSPPFESVHLPGLLGPSGAVSPRAVKTARFHLDLACFGTATVSGRVRRTPIPCRRRPGRKPCGGLLCVRRSDVPTAIDWHCPTCLAGGRITGWEGTVADLRDVDLGALDAAERIPVSVAGHTALREIALEDSLLRPLAFGAELDDASRPCLAVDVELAMSFATTIARHGLVATSPRRTELLLEIAEDLAAACAMSELLDELLDDDATGEPSDARLDPAGEFGVELARNRAPGRRRPRPNTTKRRRTGSKTFRIKVTLRDVTPPIWRRLLVPSDILLPELHDVLQAAMGWLDCHLHGFRAGRRTFSPPDDFEPVGEDSRGVALDEIAPQKGSRIDYDYDFGDGWEHEIVVEDVLDEACTSARCLAGERHCPPEDCGGPPGYEELCEVLANPRHEQHADVAEWAGADFDREAFDLADTDRRVRRVAVRRRR